MLAVKIAGIGHYLPECIVTSAELEREMGIAEGWAFGASGIQERRRATHESSSTMAAAAAHMALDHAGLAPQDLDAIIGASAAPEQAIPCTAALVQQVLGAPDGRSACFDVNATCLSFVVGLQIAAHLAAAGVYRRILLFSSEIARHSLNPHERESAVLIGDAAAAAVITRSEPGESSALCHTQMTTYGSGAHLTEVIGGGTLHHPNDPATTPEMNMFHMDGRGILRQASETIGPFLDDFFEHNAVSRAELDAVVPHQASGVGLKLLTSRFGFRPEQIVVNLPTRGNCIAASLPLALSEAVHSGRIQRGHRVLLIGTGAGLSIGAAQLTY